MDTPSRLYLRGIPTKPYDLVKEVLILLAFVFVVVIILAAVLGSPDYPTVKGEDVATFQPVTYLKACTDILAGNSSIQNYGPPYNSDTTNSQRLFGFIAPADWAGVTIPVDPQQDYIIKPLERVAVLDQTTAQALNTFKAAASDQQNKWVSNYLSSLDSATVTNGKVLVPAGDYGPVPTMMNSMLLLGQAGLLEGALENNAQTPYVSDFTNPLLFFQDDVFPDVADQLDLTGPQWGIVHETGNYPGAWWVWPYAIWYHIPPMSTSPNGDIQAGAIMIVLFLILLLLPFIPGLKLIPYGIRIYKIIWRDWYSGTRNREETSK
jgi:hypothetical protein